MPNAAHYALAKFSLPSVRHAIAPGSTFTLITQNVDGLSSRALSEVLQTATASDKRALGDEAETNPESETDGSEVPEDPPMLEMHGRLFDLHCTACEHKEWNNASPVCSALGGTEGLVDSGVIEPIIAVKDLPRCTACGALARPGVVWFGEEPMHLDTIDDLVGAADLCLVVGTSSTVRKACSGRAQLISFQGLSGSELRPRSAGQRRKSCSVQS